MYEWQGKNQFKELLKSNSIKRMVIVHSEGDNSYKFYREDLVDNIGDYFGPREIISWKRMHFKNKSINILEIKT